MLLTRSRSTSAFSPAKATGPATLGVPASFAVMCVSAPVVSLNHRSPASEMLAAMSPVRWSDQAITLYGLLVWLVGVLPSSRLVKVAESEPRPVPASSLPL
jgi:hypothetical protein